METTLSRLSGTRDYVGDDAVALGRARAALEAVFARFGYGLIDPPILERADPFLDRSGETIRRRMYIFSDPGGREICLRPELTIPACRAYLRHRTSDTEARLAYMGPAFRYVAPEDGRQFYQAGVEFIGARDRNAADAEIIALALDAVESCGARGLSVVTGDIAILSAFIAGLPIDDVSKARLRRMAARSDAPDRLAKAAAAKSAGAAPSDALAELLASIGTDKAERLLTEVFALVDLRHVGGRTPQEIVERLVTRRAQGAFEAVSSELLQGLSALFEIRGTPDAALARIADHFKALSVPFEASLLDDCRQRFVLLAKARGESDPIAFDAGLHRALEYYTGFVFEVSANVGGTMRPLCGGGRYDDLLQALGADAPIPAVGCAIGVDELLRCAAGGPA